MAYVNVADWNSEQVAEWLKGLDNVVLQYIRLFVEKNVNGQQLLDLQPIDLEKVGVYKIGHQEIILEAVGLLKNFYYDLDRENLQLLALRLSCLAHSLHSELRKNHINSSVVSTQVLADVAIVVSAVKPLVCWLDRSPFCDQSLYVDSKNEFLKLSLEMAMSGMRDRFVDKPIEYILESCSKLAKLADELIQNVDDSLLLQPASLDLATLKKRPGDHLDIYIVPSFHGILQVGELKCNSAAHQSGKIEAGDEIVQINYQTVVGWEVKEVMSLLFEESSTEVLMTLKKRPRHSKVFGQIYIKPYRLPCKKQMSYSTKWNDILPSRPELLTVPPHFGTQFRLPNSKPAIAMEAQETTRVSPPSPTLSSASSISSRSSECELMAGPSSPNSARLYLPKPRIPVQRRATITGASPVSKHAPLSLEQFWHELKLEREWRSNSDEKTGGKSNSEVQLKRSPPSVHCSLNWSVHLCELNDKPKTDMTINGVGQSNREDVIDSGIVPLKQRIDSLNRSIEQTGLCVKKPKLLPKPLLLNKNMNVKPEIAPRSPSKMSDLAYKARGRLDKSYSTPSYDYSIDSKEPLTFNMKLLEEKVKSAPDNIISDVDVRSDFKAAKVSLELRTPTKTKKTENVEHNEYLEIKSDDVELSDNDSKTAELEGRTNCAFNVNIREADEEDVTSQLQSNSSSFKRALPSDHSTANNINPNKEPTTSFVFSSKEKESSKSKEPASIYGNCTTSCNASQLSAKSLVRSPVSVPATFPRHKMETKITSPPPEPPPRPAKGSPIHLKTKNFTINKPASKIVVHKSPKTTRKKNYLLSKRRNISVKELGVCDHEGWLYHRSRKVSRGTPQWIKGWFIIKGTIFYGFNSREATRARLMISLPGFTVSPAEEVKSRNYSFKVYHTGTTFYFAAESEEDLAAWVESFSRVTISEEELSIVVSETDGEDEDDSQPTKKDKAGHEAHGSHVAAMKKFAGLLSLSIPESSKTGRDKKYNSLKKSSSQKSTKEDHQFESNHVASLDRKYLKFLGGSGKQNFMPVPTAQFRSYRRVPPMEKPPNSNSDCLQSIDSKLESANCTTPLPSASPTRPADMADYRLASLAKCNATNQRTQETSPPGGYMTLESFMLSRQEEERRHQSQHPRAANVLRVPQCHAPPPPTPTANLIAVAAIGRENFTPHQSNSQATIRQQSVATSSGGKNWTQCFSRNSKFTDMTTSTDCRSKCLKKTTQYQPLPWELPNFGSNEESRLQPAFEMTLDRNASVDNNNGIKVKKCEESSSSASRFKSLFGNTKTELPKTTLINSPRLRRVLCRDKKSQNHAPNQTVSVLENENYCSENSNLPQVPATLSAEIRLPNAPDYPGLEYPPIFEPGTYSLSDVSSLLRNRRMRTVDHIDDSTATESENNFNFSSMADTYHSGRNDDSETDNQVPGDCERARFNEDDFFNSNYA